MSSRYAPGSRSISSRALVPEPDARAIALTLFKAGGTYDEIAEKVGLKSAAAARNLVARALSASTIALDQAPSRILALERLETLHRVFWPKALRGDAAALDRVMRIDETRQRLLGEPSRVKDAISDALEETLKELETTKADAALIAACRQVARQIDHAVAHGTSLEATKAMYLLPHLWNGLRELGATPAARVALAASVPDPADAAEGEATSNDLEDWKRRRSGSGGV